MREILLFLWILRVALSSLHSTDEIRPELRKHEVVRPVWLHTHQRRDTQASQSSHSDSASFRLELKQKNVLIHLRRTRGLISSRYTETHYTTNGTRVTSVLQDQGEGQCFYHGSIEGDQQSIVSISTCSGLRGFFRTEGQDYMIEPLADSETGDHAVFKAEFFKVEKFCGVTNQTMDSALPTFNIRGRSGSMSVEANTQNTAVLKEQKYIEMFLVVDNSEFRNLGSDITKVRKRMFEIINFVNMVYFPLHTFIALVGLEVWSDEDKIKVSPPASSALSHFTEWRRTKLDTIKKNDNAQLITAVNFGSIVGLAHVGSLCTMDSTTLVRVSPAELNTHSFNLSSVQDFSSNALETGAIMAHELGHSLGMQHDMSSCSCGAAHCLMAPTLSKPPAERFSNCSIEDYEQFLQSSPALQCLLNKPAEGSIISPPVCGNGFKEEGEECDCGPVGKCSDPCCNAATCTFVPGYQCSSGECCDNCKFRPLAALCRAVKSECDLPEFCSGATADCPPDTYIYNGAPCRNNSTYCYSGLCPIRLDQCRDMWGQTAEVAPESCYQLNVQGTQDGYCRRPAPQKYIGCQEKDILCGKLFCTNGTAKPRFGTGVTLNACKTANFQDPTMDYGQVQTGTKCGDRQVCSNSECMELEVAYGEPNCSRTCRGHAVCNNIGECQCVSGWVPPDCTTRYTDHIIYTNNAESVMSKESYIIMAACLAVILSLLIVAVAVAAVWRIKRKKRERCRNHPESGGTTNCSKNNTIKPTPDDLDLERD